MSAICFHNYLKLVQCFSLCRQKYIKEIGSYIKVKPQIINNRYMEIKISNMFSFLIFNMLLLFSPKIINQYPFKRQPRKMVKHTQTTVFDHFVGLAIKGILL